MGDDVRLDILRDAIMESKLDGQIKDALADDLRFAQEINGSNDPGLRGIKRLVISGIRRELLWHERVNRAVAAHAAACPGGRIPKTPHEFMARIGSQYPIIIVLALFFVIKNYGISGLARLFGLGS